MQRSIDCRNLGTVLLTLALALSNARSARAQTPGAVPARDTLLAVVQQFFTAMGAKDSVALRKVLWPDGHAFAIVMRADSVQVRTSAHADFVTRATASGPHWRERLWQPQVLQHGPLALVWAPYDFHLDSTFSHCGVDLFTLIRDGTGWRIADVAFTIEPQGCAPSPLGPLQ